MQVDNLAWGTDILKGLAKDHILDRTNLELDNQAEEIHILVATTEAKQEEGVDHMIEVDRGADRPLGTPPPFGNNEPRSPKRS